MKNPGKKGIGTDRLYSVVSALFLPFLIFHFAWVTPVIEWSCLCPDEHPGYNCCCNCPKCVKSRGGFESYCRVRPDRSSEVELNEGTDIASLPYNSVTGRALKTPRRCLETLRCECDIHVKKVSLDSKPFLPGTTVLERFPVPVAGITSSDDRRPPEAIPCQPDKPG